MKQISCSDTQGSGCQVQCFLDKAYGRRISTNLEVDEILYLQDIFLTRGLHYISVPDVCFGRKILGNLLQAMHYYHEISCLTNYYEPPLKKTVLNIYNSLLNFCGSNVSYEPIEEFFLENFFADFMWVEHSKDLEQIPLVVCATQVMQELNIVRQIPIIVLSYTH